MITSDGKTLAVIGDLTHHHVLLMLKPRLQLNGHCLHCESKLAGVVLVGSCEGALRPWTPRGRGIDSGLKRPPNAEADIADSEEGDEPVPVGRAEHVWFAAPGTTAKNP